MNFSIALPFMLNNLPNALYQGRTFFVVSVSFLYSICNVSVINDTDTLQIEYRKLTETTKKVGSRYGEGMNIV
jgi:hypothetical protein